LSSPRAEPVQNAGGIPSIFVNYSDT